jgi:hypothetical protein
VRVGKLQTDPLGCGPITALVAFAFLHTRCFFFMGLCLPKASDVDQLNRILLRPPVRVSTDIGNLFTCFGPPRRFQSQITRRGACGLTSLLRILL